MKKFERVEKRKINNFLQNICNDYRAYGHKEALKDLFHFG
jgi:hypothetical protein